MNREAAKEMVVGLQERFVARLETLPGIGKFEISGYARNGGRHGGGKRLQAPKCPRLNRASVNVSHIYYDDEPERKLASATAISSIIHPMHPRSPSVHMHISWTHLRSGAAYWRVMADLNPSIPIADDRDTFLEAVKAVTGELYTSGLQQGERYFYIPALGRHRGIAHFYLEHADVELDYAQRFGETVIDTYTQILANGPTDRPTDQEKRQQLDYHTVYFFQVLTLDRGTTAGLLVHNENDIGILGSLPAFVDRELLMSWRERVPELQQPLLDRLVATLPEQKICAVDDKVKVRLADTVRPFYQGCPEALELQARGDVLPESHVQHGKL